MRLGVGLPTLRAAKAAKTVPVFSEALAFGVARRATHCYRCFFARLHDSMLQQALAVYQEENVACSKRTGARWRTPVWLFPALLLTLLDGPDFVGLGIVKP